LVYRSGSLIPCHFEKRNGAPDRKLDDTYAVDYANPIGCGTYGEVLAATHKKTGAPRAVKAVKKAYFAKFTETKPDFLWREWEILHHLDHPNVVRLYEAFEDELRIYLVLERCAGGDLLERVAAPVVRMSEAEAAMLFAQMLGAIQHLHVHNVVNRDIKPENFLFTHREVEREPLPPINAALKMIDFGLSRYVAPRRHAKAIGDKMSPRIGTNEYMSPESAESKMGKDFADRADMWSMGVVLHTMLTGHFPNKNLMSAPPDDYFAASFWKKFSEPVTDLLKNLIHFQPSCRLSATEALRHPFVAMASNADHFKMASSIPETIRSFASFQSLKRLVLVAAAREIDDREVAVVRNVFLRLQMQCNGAISVTNLKRAEWEHTLKDIANELLNAFDMIDVDGSGTIDWTELVASSLCSSNGLGRGIIGDNDSSYEGAIDGSSIDEHLEESVVFKTFDLLSNGSGTIVCDTDVLTRASATESAPSSRRWFLT
jgi:calcium-dependent protein kinase